MATLLERVRDALAPHYRVERTLGAAEMDVVFLAFDTRPHHGHDLVLTRRVCEERWATADRSGQSPGREARALAGRCP
jgi:hypothetical protein